MLFVFLLDSSAQTVKSPCGTDFYFDNLKKEFPGLEQKEAAFNSFAVNYHPRSKKGEVYIIPVVFHIIHSGTDETNISEERINDAMNTINEDFRKKNSDTSYIRSVFKDLAADINVEFRLAKKDPDGNCTNGITRRYAPDYTEGANDDVKSLDKWDVERYLNIWVVASIDIGVSGNGITAGYSNFPWSSRKYDGIVIRADQIDRNDRTLTHEIGHYLGLLHTFQGGCGGSCKSSGDYVCDTPPTDQPNFGCNTDLNTCSDDPTFDYPDMIENYMDYSNCRHMFTKGQRDRMLSVFSTTYSNNRVELVSQSNLYFTGVVDDPNAKPTVDFGSSVSKICAGGLVEFYNFSCGASVSKLEWQFPGGSPSISNGENPLINYNTPGTYQVTLTAYNKNGNTKITKHNFITITENTAIFETPGAIGFEDTSLDGVELESYFDGSKWERTSLAASKGENSLLLKNFSIENKNQEISFVVGGIDISNLSNPILHFDEAYAQKTDPAIELLKIYVSTDCGMNWELIQNIFSFSLKSAEKTDQFYIPNSSDFKEQSVNLSKFKGETDILIKFSFVTGQGNNIYIDNINFGAVSGIASSNPNSNKISIYPNPSNNIFNIKYNDLDVKEVRIVDVNGRKLYSEKVNNNFNNQITLNFSNKNIFEQGVFILQFVTPEEVISKNVLLIR